jgi:hypothetical protein
VTAREGRKGREARSTLAARRARSQACYGRPRQPPSSPFSRRDRLSESRPNPAKRGRPARRSSGRCIAGRARRMSKRRRAEPRRVWNGRGRTRRARATRTALRARKRSIRRATILRLIGRAIGSAAARDPRSGEAACRNPFGVTRMSGSLTSLNSSISSPRDISAEITISSDGTVGPRGDRPFRPSEFRSAQPRGSAPT